MIKVILFSMLMISCTDSAKLDSDYDSKVRDAESRFDKLYKELD
ncbi:MAG: hypothetical protein ACO2XZ_01405 [Rickettsiales bacterium]